MRIKYADGTFRDLTAEEIAEMEKAQAEIPEPEPTPEERLINVEQRTANLESNSADMMEALDMLLSGVTE